MSDCRPSENHSWTFHTVPVGSSRAAHTRETEGQRGYGSETVRGPGGAVASEREEGGQLFVRP